MEEEDEQVTPILSRGHKSVENEPTMQRQGSYSTILSGDHNYVLSVLCISFGMATWLPVNAIYTQMPILALNAPEGWSLPSYFAVLVQLANIAPLIYYFMKKRKCFPDSVLICFFLICGTTSLFLISFTYNKTLRVFDEDHSFFFFLFSFPISLVGCVSSVLFLPFMGRLPEVYLVSFFIGESLSGFVPSLLAIVQDVAKDPICVNQTVSGVVISKTIYEAPRFSPSTFFIIISTVTLFNTLSFLYLNYFSNLMQKYGTKPKITQSSEQTDDTNFVSIPKSLLIGLLTVQGIVNCFSNGILPGIMSYSCLPYGPETYHWSITINQIVGPLASYLAYFIPLVSLKLLTICSLLEVFCINYEIFSAFKSPFPPFVGTNFGSISIILVWMLGSGLISYIKLSIAAILRKRHKKALFNYGVVTQIGSAMGAILSFVLINYAGVLQAVPQKTCP